MKYLFVGRSTGFIYVDDLNSSYDVRDSIHFEEDYKECVVLLL